MIWRGPLVPSQCPPTAYTVASQWLRSGFAVPPTAFTVPSQCSQCLRSAHSAFTVASPCPATALTVPSQCLHNADTVRFAVITVTLAGEKCPTAQLQTVQQLLAPGSPGRRGRLPTRWQQQLPPLRRSGRSAASHSRPAPGTAALSTNAATTPNPSSSILAPWESLDYDNLGRGGRLRKILSTGEIPLVRGNRLCKSLR